VALRGPGRDTWYLYCLPGARRKRWLSRRCQRAVTPPSARCHPVVTSLSRMARMARMLRATPAPARLPCPRRLLGRI